VTSESGRPEDTIIDGGNVAPVAIFYSGEGRDSTLNGFTLQNGRADLNNQGFPKGGGISVAVSSPTITNNKITNNHACNGAGICVGAGSPLIQRNMITGNSNNVCTGATRGGGIDVEGSSSVEILDNVISGNTGESGGGISLDVGGTPIIKNNIIKGNNAMGDQAGGQGGGIYTNSRLNSDALIVQNLITGNQAFGDG